MHILSGRKRQDSANVRCVDDNVAFVMLTEMLRARSHEILELLRHDSPDLANVRKLALHIHLSTENLVHEAGIVAPQGRAFSPYQQEGSEPASVQGIIDLCSVAARHRLSEMKLGYDAPVTVPSDLFVNGNPWELAYALYFAIIRAGEALNATAEPTLTGGAARMQAQRSIQLQIQCEPDFADLVIAVPAAFAAQPGKTEERLQQSALSSSEWNCLQRLVLRNNAFIQFHAAGEKDDSSIQHKLVFRVPTFPAGHEDLSGLFKANAPQTI